MRLSVPIIILITLLLSSCSNTNTSLDNKPYTEFEVVEHNNNHLQAAELFPEASVTLKSDWDQLSENLEITRARKGKNNFIITDNNEIRSIHSDEWTKEQQYTSLTLYLFEGTKADERYEESKFIIGSFEWDGPPLPNTEDLLAGIAIAYSGSYALEPHSAATVHYGDRSENLNYTAVGSGLAWEFSALSTSGTFALHAIQSVALPDKGSSLIQYDLAKSDNSYKSIGYDINAPLHIATNHPNILLQMKNGLFDPL